MASNFPKWFDFFMWPLERMRFREIRRELLSKATGVVLEIGSGTGVNFPYYQDAEKVVAIEPSVQMIRYSAPKLQRAIVPIEMVQTGAERLPFEDATFDTIVATLVFCTIPDPEAAIKELKRVCKPNGRFLLFEHVRMENKFLAHLQDLLTPTWEKLCDGCCLNRDTESLFLKNGLQLVKRSNVFRGIFIVAEYKAEFPFHE